MTKRRSSTGIPGLSFSWRRALGISREQARLSREIGIPLSKSGRQRNFGRMAGCLLPVVVLIVTALVVGVMVAAMI